MTLIELGEEYLIEAQKIKEDIEKQREILEAQVFPTYEDTKKLAELYQIAQELTQTGQHLIHYYDKI